MNFPLCPIIFIESPLAFVAPIGRLNDLREGLSWVLTSEPVFAARFSPFGYPVLARSLLWRDERQGKEQLEGTLTVVAVKDDVSRQDGPFSLFGLVLVGPLRKEIDERGLTRGASAVRDLRSSHDFSVCFAFPSRLSVVRALVFLLHYLQLIATGRLCVR
jgi:hypothetical protein